MSCFMTSLLCAAERPSSAAPAAEQTFSRRTTRRGGRSPLQRDDTYHGLAWDGPGPVPRVYGLEAAKLLPKRGIFRKGVTFQPRCGLRLPDPSKGDHDA